jgi:hypothetical protein
MDAMENNELMLKLAGYVQQFGDLAKSEVPLVANEYLSWYFWMNAIGVIAALAIFILSFVGWRLSLKHFNAADDKFVASVFAFIGLAFSIILFSTTAMNVVKVSVAPRVVVLDKLAERTS